MQKLIRLSVTLLALLALAACGPAESQNPLSDPYDVKADPRLTGLWVGIRSEDRIDQYLLFAPKANGTTDFVLVMLDAKNGAHILHYEFFPTRLDGIDCMNLRMKTSADPLDDDYQLSPYYNFTKYQFDQNGGLTIWYMDNDEVADAIKDGRLEGLPDSVTITSSTAKLAEFVNGSDPERLFSILGKYKPVKLEMPRPE